ncbi:MAG: NUDIX hydrolase, partial [Nocardioides sp.]
MDSPEIVAAGAVVSRKGPQVLLVHRPKYGDWSFPKGKLDSGEHPLTAAVREVGEETGIDIRLGRPLSDQSYLAGDGVRRAKRVHYWVGRPVGDDDLSTYLPNTEIDALAWLDVDEARQRLTYPHDRDTLHEFTTLRKTTTPLIVLRHGTARSARAWRGNDRQRTLTQAGELQSDDLVPMLGAYGVARLVSSSSRRCWATLAPYADASGVDLEVTDALSEEDADEQGVADAVHGLLRTDRPAVLCTHRPVLPRVFEALGLPARPLEPAEMLVAHHRRGRVVVTEVH